MQYDKTQIFRWLFWIALTGSYILAILPQDDVPKITPLSDKGNHFIAFATLTLLLFFGYKVGYLKNTLLMFAYGIWIEVSQYFTPNRMGEIADVVANSIGIAIGLLLYFIYQKTTKQKSSKENLL